MIDFMVRWILKVTRFTSGILSVSGLTLTENMVLGVLSYHIMNFGVFVPLIILRSIKHYFQIKSFFCARKGKIK